MALLEDMGKALGGNLGSGIALTAGVLILGPYALPVIGAIVRPVAKTLIKGGVQLYEGAAQMVNDVVQEANTELNTPSSLVSSTDGPLTTGHSSH